MKNKMIIGFVVIIILSIIIFLITRNIYENFNYIKVNLIEIEKENNDKNLINILNTIKKNLDYHNDKLNKMELKLNQIY